MQRLLSGLKYTMILDNISNIFFFYMQIPMDSLFQLHYSQLNNQRGFNRKHVMLWKEESHFYFTLSLNIMQHVPRCIQVKRFAASLILQYYSKPEQVCKTSEESHTWPNLYVLKMQELTCYRWLLCELLAILQTFCHPILNHYPGLEREDKNCGRGKKKERI